MRLATFSTNPDPTPRVGIVDPAASVLWDLKQEARRLGLPLPFDPVSMVSLIAAGEAGRHALSRVLAGQGFRLLPLAEARLHAPLPRSAKNVFCVGWNYLEHFREGEAVRPESREPPAHPVFFSKAATAVTGPRETLSFDPAVSGQMDWEVELGVVIGRAGRDIAEADAFAHVFGYTVINDVSARDVQWRHGGQWLKGKSLDGSCPMGPWIVTADALDPTDLSLTTRVNGVVKQQARTQQMYFKVPRIIAELSRGMTLEPGDVIATGTPAGVGFARKPPEFLRSGDVLETEIEGIGMLRNPVRFSPARLPAAG